MTDERWNEIVKFAETPHIFEDGSRMFSKEQVMLQELIKHIKGKDYWKR